MLKKWTFVLFFACCTPVIAINKCTGQDGRIFYDNQASSCDGETKILDITQPSIAEIKQSTITVNRDKERLHKEETKRRYQVLKEEKIESSNAHRMNLNKKKCNRLALQKKWAAEDLSRAKWQFSEKAKRHFERSSEKYQLECGGIA